MRILIREFSYTIMKFFLIELPVERFSFKIFQIKRKIYFTNNHRVLLVKRKS